jgi:PIN domain
MRIVLDANIFHADFRMEGNAFRVFTSALRRIGGSLIVTQVVLDEVTHNYREELRDIAACIAKAALRWRRLTGCDLSGGIPDDRIQSQACDYNQWLATRLQSLGAQILPYPTTPHSEMAKRSMEHRRPFQESGSGYRDTLIWESMKSLCGGRGSTIYLVTKNRRDFGEGPSVHPHLEQDLLSAGYPPGLIRIFASLEDLNAQLVMPKLERLDDLLRRFSKDLVPEFSLQSWAEWGLKDLLRDDDWTEALVGLTQDHSHAWLSTMKEAPTIDVDDVRLLPNGDVLVAATASIQCEVAVDGDPGAYYRYEDVRGLWGDEPPSESSTAWFPVSAKIALSLILRGDSFELLSAEVDEIDGDYGSVHVNPHPTRSS